MNLKLSLMTGVAVASLAIVTLLGGTDSVRAQTFNPVYEVCLDDAFTYDPDTTTPGDPEECDGDNSAGAHTDITTILEIPSGDVQFAGAVFFIPPEWTITPGDDIPIGAVVGELLATVTLGLINGACFNPLPVGFLMLNASIDTSDTVPYLDTEEDDPGAEGYGLPDYFEDKDNSGLQDGFERYPEFIIRVLDDILGDEIGEPLQPIRRSAGITIIAGVEVLLQFLIFEPGTPINENIRNDAELGYPSVTLLQNIGDPTEDPIPSAITDFCTPLRAINTSFGVSRDNGCTDSAAETLDAICEVRSVIPEIVTEEQGGTDPDEGGFPLLTNPAEGDYNFTFVSAGQRDADGDGIENSLDTCAFAVNQGDPRIAGDGDEDNDGLDAACDPDDDNINSDEDVDGYLNRQDNCPLVPNGEEGSNQRDTDNDSIGDDCDPNPDDADAQGELIFAEGSPIVTIGPGSPPSEETPDADETPAADDDGGGSTLIIIIVVIAAVAIVGGGAFYFMRRGGGGGATA